MLEADSNLSSVKEVEGYKVLPPCVLYGKIGQGGMGAVYRGRHLNLDIDVAVKCLKPDLTGEDEQFVVRFRREAKSAAHINHQNVVRVFDVSEEEGLHYIVMELVQGETARQRVKRKQSLAVGEALEIVYGAACGLGEAHSKGFIHRDIKPDNLMIASNGAVKVADLGLAKPSGQNNMSMLSGTNVVMGTPHYMPPEQWENTATVTAAADIWSLGATLYYLLVGGEAIEEKSLPAIMQRIVLQDFPDVRVKRPDVPADVAEFIQRATRKDPAERFADAAEMARAIEQLETRRQTLEDNAAVAEPDQNTLLSPPPAKTLAKIKFWLDEQAQGGFAEPEDEGQTIVSPASRRGPIKNEQQQPAKKGGMWGLIAALLVLGTAVGIWQPWRPGTESPFAAAESHRRAGNFAAALQATRQAFADDPSLTGQDARLAGIHLAWARSLGERNDLRAAFEQIANSVALQQSAAATNLKRSLLAKAAISVDSDLRRTAPDTTPLPRGRAVEFRGRFASDLGGELRIGGETVELAPDGLFVASRELSGGTRVPVEVRLTTGENLTLAPWQVVYAPATSTPSAAAGKPDEDNGATAQVASKPAGTETQDGGDPAANGRDVQPVSSGKPEPRVELTLATEPERIQVRGDQASPLTIRVPRGADIRIDGVVVARNVQTGEYVHQVKSPLARPAALEVVARLGSQEQRRRVPVSRVATALAFVGKVEFEGLRFAKDGVWGTADASVNVVGECSTVADRILINGAPAQGLVWKGRRFSARVPLQPGRNDLNVVAERRLYTAVAAQLQVERVAAPTLQAADKTQLKATVRTPTYAVAFDVDRWTNVVEVVNGGSVMRLVNEPRSLRFRGNLPLRTGTNRFVVRATNLFGKSSQQDLTVTLQVLTASSSGNAPSGSGNASPEAARPAGSQAAPVTLSNATVPPEIQGVQVRDGSGVQDVRPGRQVFLTEVGNLYIDSNDALATVRINDKPVGRAADGTVPLTGLLSETKPARITVVLENPLGKSESFRFVAWLDKTKPGVQCLEPGQKAVPRGQPFELSGRWQDNGGLERDGSRIGELEVRLSPRGVAKKGTWKVTHPGLQKSTTLYLDVVDRAGNKTRLPIEVRVQ